MNKKAIIISSLILIAANIFVFWGIPRVWEFESMERYFYMMINAGAFACINLFILHNE